MFCGFYFVINICFLLSKCYDRWCILCDINPLYLLYIQYLFLQYYFELFS